MQSLCLFLLTRRMPSVQFERPLDLPWKVPGLLGSHLYRRWSLESYHGKENGQNCHLFGFYDPHHFFYLTFLLLLVLVWRHLRLGRLYRAKCCDYHRHWSRSSNGINFEVWSIYRICTRWWSPRNDPLWLVLALLFLWRLTILALDYNFNLCYDLCIVHIYVCGRNDDLLDCFDWIIRHRQRNLDVRWWVP